MAFKGRVGERSGRFVQRLAAWLCLGCGTALGQETWLLRDVRVETRDVFAEEEAAGSWLYRAFNALHATTSERVVRRELWFGPGDRIGDDQRAELERNLRATELFGAVEVRLEETGTPGEADLVVDTRDRFSLIASANGSLVGGVQGYDVLVGERNLLGSGDELSLSVGGNSANESEFRVNYVDRYLLDSWHRLDLSVGRTEEGPFLFAGVTRPHKHLRDPYAWGLSASYVESDHDYFVGGESVAAVPNEATAARAFAERAGGPPDLRRSLGVDLRFEDTRYGLASGPAAGSIDVPGDVTQVALGPYGRVEWAPAYRQRRHLDTLDFVQDLTLGIEAELFAGAQHRDEQGAGERLEPLVRASVRAAAEPSADTYVTWAAGGTGRWYAGEAQGWTASAALHAFHLSLPRQTLALSLTYDEVLEDEGLPQQLNLGEDNGLRGYPAREFAGRERYRLNLEDRVDTGLAVSSFHLGLVAFFDAGWIGFDGAELDDPLRSVGCGLRIGSSEVLGPEIVRIDLAFPLDGRSGEDYGPTLSLAFGQVFGFFGNASTLSSR